MGNLRVKDHIVLFDDADEVIIEAYQWHLHISGTNKYARGYLRGSGGKKQIYMHRLLAKPALGEEVDHRNGSGLDNRRENLRCCNRSQNNANRKFIASSTGVKGVHFESYTGKWRAEIQLNGKRYRLGRFETQDAAAEAYRTAALKLFGEFTSHHAS
jgi:hypothetical protein